MNNLKTKAFSLLKHYVYLPLVITLLLSENSFASFSCVNLLNSSNILQNPGIQSGYDGAIDGSEVIPHNERFGVIIEGENGRQHTILWKTLHINKLRNDLKGLILDLKHRSLHNTQSEREMASILVEYSDGSSKAIKFTSNEHTYVRGEDATKAVSESNIFRPAVGIQITRVIHIHTHPDVRNGAGFFIPNDDDFMAYSNLRDQLRNINPSLSFIGIVAPSCENCGGIIQVVNDQAIDRFNNS